MIDDSKKRPPSPEEGSDDLSQYYQRANIRKAIITASQYQYEIRGWKKHHYERALAWYEALSARVGRTSHMPEELSAVVKLLWEQHVLGEPNQSQIQAFYAVIRGGDRLIVTQAPGRVRRTVARLGGFLFQDVREVLDEDAEEVSKLTHFWVYAPLAGTQGWDW